jgi:uridine kinase
MNPRALSIPIVIYGPQACGKTRLIPALQARFPLKPIIDDWDPFYDQRPLPDNAIALTNCHRDEIPARYVRLAYDHAKQLLG